MKLLHLADLHIGKRVNEFSMLEEQKEILEQILDMAKEQQADGVLIAGDIYDKPLPSGEAVAVVDWFFTSLSRMGIPVFAISGNHDSPERVAYGADLFERNGIYLAGQPKRQLYRAELADEFGPVHIYFLPFLREAHVRAMFPGERFDTLTDAVKRLLEEQEVDEESRNVILVHQFLAGGSVSGSEEAAVSVGGLDSLDVRVLDRFDYAALGHLHGAQRVGRDTVRYSGSPLKYSFSEVLQEKSVTLVELREKGNIQITLLPLTPRRDLRRIRGPLAELLSPEVVSQGNPEDYLQVVLTDEDELLDVMNRVRAVYPNVMRLEFDNCRSRQEEAGGQISLEGRQDWELFADFYELQNGRRPDEEQLELVKELLGAAGTEKGEGQK